MQNYLLSYICLLSNLINSLLSDEHLILMSDISHPLLMYIDLIHSKIYDFIPSPQPIQHHLLFEASTTLSQNL
jgi:hypothetical protein